MAARYWAAIVVFGNHHSASGTGTRAEMLRLCYSATSAWAHDLKGFPMSTASQFIDQKLFTEHGEEIGKIRDVINRPSDLEPEWLVVKTAMFGGEHLVPIVSVSQRGASLTVPFDKKTVKASPSISAHVPPLTEQSQATYMHYGVKTP